MTLNLPDQEICEKYLNGINTVKLAKEYNCDQGTIIKRLKDNKIKIRSRSESLQGIQAGENSFRYIKLPIEEICEKYLNGISPAEIGKEYGVSNITIYNRLYDNGIEIKSSGAHIGRQSGKNHPSYIELSTEEICKKYINGMSLHQLAKEYNCSTTPIIQRLKDNKIKIRSSGEMLEIELPIEEIIEKYENGVSANKIAKEYKCDVNIIIRRLRNNNIRIKSRSESNTGHYTLIIPIKEIIKKYKNGFSLYELAKEYNCDSGTIIKRLKNNNIKIRHDLKKTERTRQHISATHQGIPYDEWKDFSKKQEYCNLFNLTLKEAIRLYFNNKCFMDNEPEDNGRATSVHHVNFDKRCGCDATQLCIFVPVKAKWNSIFNGNKEHNRWYWYSFLMIKIFMEHPNYFTYHIPVWGMNELEYNYSYVFEKFRRK